MVTTGQSLYVDTSVHGRKLREVSSWAPWTLVQDFAYGGTGIHTLLCTTEGHVVWTWFSFELGVGCDHKQ